MTEHASHKCLTREQWEAYLQPLAIENKQWHQHLEHCAHCRDTLVNLAGEPTWWDEAEQWLANSGEPGLRQFVEKVTESVCALSLDADADDEHDPLCEFEIKQLQHMLAPAGHPELLGRIGRYELEQLVGRGGMGLVFRARDIELHRIVAVKTLAVHLIPIAAARERFIREARASAALVHPHIVPVHDVITEGPIPALVMQFIAGPTLEVWLRKHGRIEWRSVLQLAIQLADALSAAHACGLVHRDVKPGNVLLEADGSRALLSDFGLVRTLDAATLTRSGMLAGTPDYMSPEQARGETVVQSSDLFSVGSMLYAMLTGHPPFRASDPMAVMNRICHQAHRRLTECHPEIPIEVSRMVDKLLSKEPKRRFQSATELREHLQELATSPLRLKHSDARPSKQWWLIVASVAILILGASLVSLRDFNTPNYSTSQQLNRSFASPSTVEQPSAATNGFADLKALDAQIKGLDQRSLELQHELGYSRTRRGWPAPRSAVRIDQQLQQIKLELLELEQELSPQ